MNKFEKAVNLQQKIESNKKLKALELDGFVNGEEKGKTMQGIDAERMYWIVKTQINDFALQLQKNKNSKRLQTYVM
jgi:transcription initiation factor IIE alpha subunit